MQRMNLIKFLSVKHFFLRNKITRLIFKFELYQSICCLTKQQMEINFYMSNLLNNVISTFYKSGEKPKN